MLRVKIPCDSEAEFYARIADRIAVHGLRVPAEVPPALGARARVALEFRDGGVLAGDAVVEEHVEVDDRPGVKVRFLKLDRPGEAPAAPGGPPALPAAPDGPRASDLELAETLFGDEPSGDGRIGTQGFTRSTEIAAAVHRRTARFQRAAVAAAVLAILVSLGGFAVARWSGAAATPDEVAAAHVKAADRLLAEGRLTGKDGALDHLLAARRLRPEDDDAARRLDRLADMLERLATGALERGDLAVASIHLASARAADPDRRSLRAKQAELDRRARPAAATAPRPPRDR